MIAFFRKIRYNLIEKNKTGKYFKYAIGEIILVVIGILIALQINNWNQGQQNKKLTNLYINDLIREVNTDITTLNKRIEVNENMVINIESILMTLGTKKELAKNELLPFYKLHMSLAFESYFIPEKSTFLQIESTSNGRLIRNKTLRDKLYQYYSLNDRNEKNGEISLQLYQHNFYTKDILQNILSGDLLEIIYGMSLNRPNLDLEELRQNSEYIWALGGKKVGTLNQNRIYQTIIVIAENLVDLLETELEN